MNDSFDKLIEETREKYRVSWEKSLKKYKKYCELQDEDFEWAIKYGNFPPKITIERILVEAKPRKLNAKYSIEVFQDKVSYSEEAFNEVLSQIKKQSDEDNYIIMHPELYKLIENYKNQNPLQRFLWNIKWGFRECADNFRNWQGHMMGEDWDFWEVLNGEWSSYE